jgi:lysophospholipase L1-like esterase
MKNTIHKKRNSPAAAVFGMLLLLIFITGMNHSSENQKPYTLLALGDSYTIGEMVPAGENFPNQVRRLLAGKGFAFSPPEIVAKTGWTTDELQEAIRKEKISGSYDFVTLLIGVNNQYRGRNTENYSVEFEALLQQAIRFAGNDPFHVIVLSIPDWGITPFASGRNREEISRNINAYNEVNKRVAAGYRVHYIDITPGTREAADDPSLLASDGLHPSGSEYAKWAKQVAAVIEKTL